LTTTVLCAAGVALAVALLIEGERRRSRWLIWTAKPVASALFVALSVLRLAAGDTYGGWVVTALVLCAVGDLLLLGERTFDGGLVIFLAAHLAYVSAFHGRHPLSAWPLWMAALLVVPIVVVARWLWPHLGRRRLPVLLYMVVVSLMLWAALSTAAAGAVPWFAAVGALAFYLSDLSVARDRFVKRSFANRALGLPPYYLGQVLLALSVGA